MQGLGHENVKELMEEIGGLMAWLNKGTVTLGFFIDEQHKGRGNEPNVDLCLQNFLADSR